jgi:hypothetical protein
MTNYNSLLFNKVLFKALKIGKRKITRLPDMDISRGHIFQFQDSKIHFDSTRRVWSNFKGRRKHTNNGIFLHNKDQQDANFFLLIYFNNHPLHVSNRLAIYQQEAVYCICSI